ncbi:MAG TPA: hypothetical protein VF412_13890 [Bdellovibrio sp.]|uniref:hypothetical protein n=1 Tax=Bdellovibrio sp. TaxID=28201 RepID=UPI002EEAA353
MLWIRTFVGTLSIFLSLASAAQAAPVMAPQQRAYFAKYQNMMVGVIRSTTSENIANIKLLSVNGYEFEFAVHFYSDYKSCYRAKVGEIKYANRGKMILKDLVRDTYCD